MKYLFWPPVAAIGVVLMLCIGLLRIVFHLVWDFRFMGWREAYTFCGEYEFEGYTWKDMLMEIVNPDYVVKDKNEEEDEEEDDKEEDEDVRPNPKFDIGQLVRVVDINIAVRIVKAKGYDLHDIDRYCGQTFAVYGFEYDNISKGYVYDIRQWTYKTGYIPEELLEEYVKPEDEL